MSNLTMFQEKKLNRLYHHPVENTYSHFFFQELSTGLSSTLGNRSGSVAFFSFEPKGCEVERLYKKNMYSDFSNSMEQMIQRIIYSLMVYGKAYVYINPEYAIIKPGEGKSEIERKILSVEVEEIKGIVKKKINDKVIFLSKGFSGNILNRELVADGLISLNIRDIGYSKNYFTRMMKKLGKYDVSPTMTLSQELEGYDFSTHIKKNKIAELKITRGIGCSLGNSGLSDSYILYRKIQQDKFKIKAITYILRKINDGITKCLDNENSGKLMAHIREIDYDKIWKEFQTGEITVTEFANRLYEDR
jgi:hypothetical protein